MQFSLQILLQLEYGIYIQESANVPPHSKTHNIRNNPYISSKFHLTASVGCSQLSLSISPLLISFSVSLRFYNTITIAYHSIYLHPLDLFFTALSLLSPFSLYFSVNHLQPFVGVIRSCRTQTLRLSHWCLFFFFLLVVLQHQVKQQLGVI